MIRQALWVLVGSAAAVAVGLGLIFFVTFGAAFLPRETGPGANAAVGAWALLMVSILAVGARAALLRMFGGAPAPRPAPAPAIPADVKIDASAWRRSGRCPVCRTPGARRAIAWCARCLTPHHEDCWRYAGKCAVFACGGDVPRFASRP